MHRQKLDVIQPSAHYVSVQLLSAPPRPPLVHPGANSNVRHQRTKVINAYRVKIRSNYHNTGSIIYLQILLAPSLMHYIDQQVLQAAFYCLADQIQVFGRHSSTVKALHVKRLYS